MSAPQPGGADNLPQPAAELRLAVAFTGGVSLAVWMGGMARGVCRGHLRAGQQGSRSVCGATGIAQHGLQYGCPFRHERRRYQRRHLADPERQFADKVFQGKLDYDRVLLTNLVGMGNRPFTTALPGNLILVNLGQGCDHPTTYTGNGGADDGENAPGQLLIHELTHAWQICNSSFTPAYYCRAISTAASTAGGNMSAYVYGPAGQRWGDYGTEQQASASRCRLSKVGLMQQPGTENLGSRLLMSLSLPHDYHL
jgi:hypothetical protein